MKLEGGQLVAAGAVAALVAGGTGFLLGRYVCSRGQSSSSGSRVNHSQSLDSAKIVTLVDVEDIGQKRSYCRCWHSKTFPVCDGSHNEHNKLTGDNVGPLVVTKKE